MKKLMLALVAAVTIVSAPQAKADVLDTYVCKLEGQMRGLRLGFGLGGQLLKGRGEVVCVNENKGLNDRVVIPVKLALVGGGFSFDFNVVREINLVTIGIGKIRSPYDLTGQFSVGPSAGYTLIHNGLAVQSAISVKNRANGLGFEIGLQGERAYGLGARLEGVALLVKPLQ